MAFAISLLGCITVLGPSGAGAIQDLKVPEGFVVSEYAGPELANDIFCLTVDAMGRIVVAGRGYIRTLVDSAGTGRADRAIPYATTPSDGAQGLLAEGPHLYCTGDGGLRRFVDADGDGRADGPPTLLATLRTGQEHGAHAVRRGPDGWLYVLCGNTAGVSSRHATTPRSPIREPIAGAVLRFSPDFKDSEIVADGFRNAYDLDFTPNGSLFTYDSDNERCLGLPWYEPTRLYQVHPGGNYGWRNPQRSEFWRLPPYFPDVVPPLATLGRGSPTALVCYRHTAFPQSYQGGLFAGDWTFGRIYFIRLTRSDGRIQATPTIFLQAMGTTGFAPTSACVHPETGDLFVATGGRGTRGAVYRIRHVGRTERSHATPIMDRTADLLAPDANEREGLARTARIGDLAERIRALQKVVRFASEFDAVVVKQIVSENAASADRDLRRELVRLLGGLPPNERLALLPALGRSGRLLIALACPEVVLEDVALAQEIIAAATNDALSITLRLEAIRVLQLALGDVGGTAFRGRIWEGYANAEPRGTARFRQGVALRLCRCLPTGIMELDREITRTLALTALAAPEGVAAVMRMLGTCATSAETLHTLAALARLPGPRSKQDTQATAAAVVRLESMVHQERGMRDNHWPVRLRELVGELCRVDPALGEAILRHPEFGHPAHARFARVMGPPPREVAQRFWDKIGQQADFSWTSEVVGLVSELRSPDVRRRLCELWDQVALRDAIVRALADQPEASDRAIFVWGLSSNQPETLRSAIRGLASLEPMATNADEVGALIAALGRASENSNLTPLKDAVLARLRFVTKETSLTHQAEWRAWYAKTHPHAAKRWLNPDGVDQDEWNRILAKVDWAAGDAQRGHDLYRKLACSACHSGGGALGPDLTGITQRFAREDVFTAILQPSKDVADRYRASVVVTKKGQIFTGLVIYRAVDGLILQTGSNETLRIDGSELDAVQPAPLSLMPKGLLDGQPPAALADLYAYLKSLKPSAK